MPYKYRESLKASKILVNGIQTFGLILFSLKNTTSIFTVELYV